MASLPRLAILTVITAFLATGGTEARAQSAPSAEEVAARIPVAMLLPGFENVGRPYKDVNGDDSTEDFLAASLTARLQLDRRRFLVFGEGTYGFAGGGHAGRVGVVGGWRGHAEYSEVGVETTETPTTITTTWTATTYPGRRKVPFVYGPVFGVGFRSVGGGDAGTGLSATTLDADQGLTLEAGFAAIGQYHLLAALTYDVLHAAAGLRFETMFGYDAGAVSLHTGLRAEVGVSNGDDAMTGLVLGVVMGVGPGMRTAR